MSLWPLINIKGFTMEKINNFINNYCLRIFEGFSNLMDALDFLHPMVIMVLFFAIIYAIYTFLPVWIGIAFLVLIVAPLLVTLLEIIRVFYVTNKLNKNNHNEK